MKKIVLAVNSVNFKDEEKKNNQDIAFSFLKRNAPPSVFVYSFNFENEIVNIPNGPVVENILKRDSSEEIKNTRRLPYVKDFFEKASLKDCDIFGYMNSDIIIVEKFFDIFSGDFDAYILGRYEVEKVIDLQKDEFKIIERPYKTEDGQHVGFDAFFFKKEWWEENNKLFHKDFIMGEPYWDMYYDKRIRQLTGNFLKSRCLYHIFHKTIWSTNSIGGKNNLVLMNTNS